MAKDETPEPPRDDALARAIGANQDRETVEHNASLVLDHWRTLTEGGMDEETARDSTLQFQAMSFGE